MKLDITPYVDGWWGSERQVTVIPRPKFPFKKSVTPDVYTRQYERDYRVNPKQWVPKAANRTSWTNLLIRSEEFDNASWTKTNLTVAANAGTAPDGQVTFDKLTESTTNAEHSVSQAATLVAVTHEASVFVKANALRRWIKVGFTDSAAASFSAFFDFSAGVAISPSAGVVAFIVPLGLGQFRCVIRFTPAAGAGTFKINVATDASTISYAGSLSASLFLWGAAIVAGTDTPYVSTTNVTRAISAPDRDPVDPLAFLLEEEDPKDESSESEIIRRLFGRVPLPQTVPSSQFVTLPAFSGDFPQQVGIYVLVQPDPNVSEYVAYLKQAVTADSGAATGTLVNGTYTLTFGAQTTAAIAYNATAAQIQTALNLLSGVSDRDGLTVALLPAAYNPATPYDLLLTWNNHALPTIDATNITVSAGTKFAYANNNGVGIGWGIIAGISTSGGGAVNGGTFTMTFFGQTTAAIAYNATTAQAASAINALSNVAARGGVVVYGDGFSSGSIFNNLGSGFVGLFIYFVAPSLLTGNGAQLVPIGSSISVTNQETYGSPQLGQSRRIQAVYFTAGAVLARSFTKTAHGIIAGDSIYVKIGDEYFTIATGLFTVPDANTITITATAGAAFTAAGTATEIGKRVLLTYKPGLKNSRINRVTTYYLPGVTPGITTVDDIPLPVWQGDAVSLIAAIIAGSTSINYEVGELAQYLNSPILARTIVTLNASTL